MASPRVRITARLRQEIVERYIAGTSTRAVAAEFGIGKSTVLKILRVARAEVRPRTTLSTYPLRIATAGRPSVGRLRA